jgi:hypothetical protein
MRFRFRLLAALAVGFQLVLVQDEQRVSESIALPLRLRWGGVGGSWRMPVLVRGGSGSVTPARAAGSSSAARDELV